MGELSKKYDQDSLVEEEGGEEEDVDECESESPPDSDSDFEIT